MFEPARPDTPRDPDRDPDHDPDSGREDTRRTEPKPPLDPNPGKRQTVVVGRQAWARVPIQTALFTREDLLADRIVAAVSETVSAIEADDRLREGLADRWYVVVSEKVVAITQGRSYFTWEINPSRVARALARFVRRTPYGIGLGSPWTMQLAIREAGLPRIVVAAAASLVGKVLGRRGWFYLVAGHRVNAIDGPTPYSAYPSNVSAKLPPKDPELVARQLTEALRERLPGRIADQLGGTVVIDSNDLGRDVLGHDTGSTGEFFCELFADNPFGQGRQQTPIAVCLPTSDTP